MPLEKGSATVPVALFGVSPNSSCGRLHSPFGAPGPLLPGSSAGRRRERSRRPRSPSSNTSFRLGERVNHAMISTENISINGIGAVSPAGWGVLPLRETLAKGEPLPVKELARPGWTRSLRVRPVPPPSPRPNFLAHARLRRTSPITQYAVAAALEALGNDAARVSGGSLRLGIVFCVMTGCVNYSRRFYDETLTDPATASPLVFPETVFNAPASHLSALLGTTAINYTPVGGPATSLQGIALAADWLLSEQVDGCLVIGAEEMDWLTAEAVTLFASQAQTSDGAGA